MDGNLSRNLETYFPLIGNALHLTSFAAATGQEWL